MSQANQKMGRRLLGESLVNDDLIQRLIRMSGEADGLEHDDARAARRPAGCLGMRTIESLADGGAALSAMDERHVRTCTICGPRWEAMLASRPAAARPTAPSRWYRFATALTAAAACVAATFTILPRPSGSSSVATGSGAVNPIAAVEPPVIAVPTSLFLCIPGDSNCDGVVDSADLAALGFAVHRPEEYADRFPNCDAVCSNDVNGDNVVDECDLDELVQCVGG